MNIKLNAYRINQTDTTVFITFSQIIKDGLIAMNSKKIINKNGEIGVVFHIKNDSQTEISSGTETLSFKADFDIETEKVRVFYWNDSDSLSDNIYCFEEFLEQHGVDERVPEGYIPCEKSQNKAKDIPRQAGNGGVVGIFNIP